MSSTPTSNRPRTAFPRRWARKRSRERTSAPGDGAATSVNMESLLLDLRRMLDYTGVMLTSDVLVMLIVSLVFIILGLGLASYVIFRMNKTQSPFIKIIIDAACV